MTTTTTTNSKWFWCTLFIHFPNSKWIEMQRIFVALWKRYTFKWGTSSLSVWPKDWRLSSHCILCICRYIRERWKHMVQNTHDTRLNDLQGYDGRRKIAWKSNRMSNLLHLLKSRCVTQNQAAISHHIHVRCHQKSKNERKVFSFSRICWQSPRQ